MKRFVVLLALLLSVFASGIASSQQGDSGGLCSIYNSIKPTSKISSVRSGFWSDPATWGGSLPDAGDNVVVDHDVVADLGVANELQVNGSLEIKGDLAVHASLIVCESGYLGGSQGQINFHVEDDRAFASNVELGPVSGAPGFHPEDNGLWALGTVDLNGPEVTSWLDAVSIDGVFNSFEYDVSQSAAFAKGVARLAAIPVGWQVGDELLLVTERGEHFQAKLKSVDGDFVSYIPHSQAGELPGYVMELEDRAIHPKVANLSRRLKIVSANVLEGDSSHRAHTAYLRGSTVNIRNVEFRNLGPRAKLGRYPLHWHMAQESTGGVWGSSIWQSVDEGGNRFVVPHIVNGITVADNVAFRSQGHGYFMEEVMEYDNQITGNLSVDVRHGEELPNVHSSISNRTHHFWLRESNEISGNVAAGNDWDGRGLGNKGPGMDGLVVLPSSELQSTPLVSDFECLGCGGTGMWSAVPNTLFEDPASTYALVAGYRATDKWNTDSSGSELLRPSFFFNGNNDLFAETGDYADRVPWASQIYVNYGEIKVSGGVLTGNVGVHAHYNARFSINNTSAYGHIFVDQTYWEMIANVDDSRIRTANLFSGGYGRAHRMSPGFARLTNTCFGSDCDGSSGMMLNNDFTGPKFIEMMETNVEVLQQAGLGYVATTAPLPNSGFVRIPEQLGARFWQVTPAGSDSEPEILAIQERESQWMQDLVGYGGYLDGFPPGDYEVNLFSAKSDDTYISSGTFTIYEGLISEICLDGESCEAAESPMMVVVSPSAKKVSSGEPIYFSGYAKDLGDGILTESILWQSSIDGLIGQGSDFEATLSDGYHTIEAGVVDSDGNAAASEFTIGVGSSSSGASSAAKVATSDATLAGGVAVFVATTDCNGENDPHWQCGGSWTSPDSISAESWVAYCPGGETDYLSCMSSDEFVQVGDLAVTDAIGVCVGVTLEGGSRNDCVNSRGPEGSGYHSYVEMGAIIQGLEGPDPQKRLKR